MKIWEGLNGRGASEHERTMWYGLTGMCGFTWSGGFGSIHTTGSRETKLDPWKEQKSLVELEKKISLDSLDTVTAPCLPTFHIHSNQ